MIRLDGPLLARAWLSVAAAASSDKDDPQLYKAVAIEEHPTGVRLIATDRHIMLTSWIPDLLHQYGMGAHEPGIATLPDRTVIAADIDGRARSMLGHIIALAGRVKKADYTIGDVEVSIDFDASGPASVPAGFDGMDPKFVVLKSPDVETVYVPTVEMAYADWRQAFDAHKAKPAGDVMYSSELLERIGKVGKNAGEVVRLHLGGSTTPTRIEFPGSDPDVSGVLVVKREKVDEVNPVSTHAPTLGLDQYVRCPACPGWRAGPFGPQQLISAGLAQSAHILVASLNDAFARGTRSRRQIVESYNLPPSIADIAADERAKLQRWWDRELDALWASYGWTRPTS